MALLCMLALSAACGNNRVVEGRAAAPHPVAAPQAAITVQVPAQPFVPAPLVAPNLDLYAPPVSVPLQVKIPSIGVDASVLAVGLTGRDVMDAPQGAPADPVWREAFWYRGGGIPGASGTATIAGHLDDVLGRPAVFARLKDLRPGDAILILDTRVQQEMRFVVSASDTYSEQQATNPAILAQVYGPGPAAGTAPQPAPDGLAHLTLITCAGNYVHGAYDHHVVVYAQRVTIP